MITGITISNADNERKIEAYRNGEIQVLINVNILTEGTDDRPCLTAQMCF